jgi:hypothetical protein
MSGQIVTGKSAAYPAASEALHRDPVADRQAARFHKLRQYGLPTYQPCNEQTFRKLT